MNNLEYQIQKPAEQGDLENVLDVVSNKFAPHLAEKIDYLRNTIPTNTKDLTIEDMNNLLKIAALHNIVKDSSESTHNTDGLTGLLTKDAFHINAVNEIKDMQTQSVVEYKPSLVPILECLLNISYRNLLNLAIFS